MISDVDEMVGTAVQNVFETMLNTRAQPIPKESLTQSAEAHVAGAVGFIGRLTGVVYLHTTESFARRITCNLLGLSEHEIATEEMVNDAIGEMANMVVGNLKSRLADRGIPCVLTIPSVVRGSQFSVESVSSTEGRLLAFACTPYQMLVQVLIKPIEHQNA